MTSHKDINVDLQQALTSLKQNVSIAQQLASEMSKSDAFVSLIPPFLQEAEQTMTYVSRKFERYKTEFSNLLEYFGYAKTKARMIEADMFFGLMVEFVKKFSETIEKQERLKKAAAKQNINARFKGGKVGAGLNPLQDLAKNIKKGKLIN